MLLVGGKCQTCIDGFDGICGKALGAHPLAQGNVNYIISVLYYLQKYIIDVILLGGELMMFSILTISCITSINLIIQFVRCLWEFGNSFNNHSTVGDPQRSKSLFSNDLF